MLKLRFSNPIYKQVFGEFSLCTGSAPGQAERIRGSSRKRKPEKRQSSSVRRKRHTARVPWCAKFRHRLHGEEKVVYTHVRGGNAYRLAKYYERYFVHWSMTWCHKSLHLEKKITSWCRLKRAHYASKPFDLLEITITFLRQLRKWW